MRGSSSDLKLNYYALTVAIMAECTVETAFEKLQSAHPDKVTRFLTPEDTLDMKKFRDEGMLLKEIAEIYNMPWKTVYGRVRSRNRRIACGS